MCVRDGQQHDLTILKEGGVIAGVAGRGTALPVKGQALLNKRADDCTKTLDFDSCAQDLL